MITEPPVLDEAEIKRRLEMAALATDSERKMLHQYWATLDAGLMFARSTDIRSQFNIHT